MDLRKLYKRTVTKDTKKATMKYLYSQRVVTVQPKGSIWINVSDLRI